VSTLPEKFSKDLPDVRWGQRHRLRLVGIRPDCVRAFPPVPIPRSSMPWSPLPPGPAPITNAW